MYSYSYSLGHLPLRLRDPASSTTRAPSSHIFNGTTHPVTRPLISQRGHAPGRVTPSCIGCAHFHCSIATSVDAEIFNLQTLDHSVCIYAMLRLHAVRPGAVRDLSICRPSLRRCIQRRGIYVLGIETSCDDTCVALLNITENLSHLHRSLKVSCANRQLGGIEPRQAVQSHTRNLPALVHDALLSLQGRVPDLIAVTRGPGMNACLGVGVSFAKALSVAWNKPLVGVHHMQAHALTIHLEGSFVNRGTQPRYPFLTLLYGLPVSRLYAHGR